MFCKSRATARQTKRPPILEGPWTPQMKAMLLAAGRGERLRPLTDHTPKPLLKVGGQALIVWQLEKLKCAGISEVVINLAYLGEQIETYLGNGSAWGLTIEYSREPAGALETAGGIRQALDWLGNAPFVLANADVWTDFDFALLPVHCHSLAHLVLVENRPHHPQGDFGLLEGRVTPSGEPNRTYAGIGIYAPGLFESLARGVRAPLAPLLRAAIDKGAVTGQLWTGQWIDVGTVERLEEADLALRLAARDQRL